jgi:hypothetical protein
MTEVAEELSAFLLWDRAIDGYVVNIVLIVADIIDVTSSNSA